MSKNLNVLKYILIFVLGFHSKLHYCTAPWPTRNVIFMMAQGHTNMYTIGMTYTVILEKWGNVHGIKFPDELVKQLNFKLGQKLYLHLGDANTIIVSASPTIRGENLA